MKKGVLKNFAKFIGKHQSEALNFIKKEALEHALSCEFCEIFNNTFFHRTPPLAVSLICILPLFKLPAKGTLAYNSKEKNMIEY